MQSSLGPRLSVVVPVYGNEDSIASLLAALATLNTQVAGGIEAIFVVDGSPDRSLPRLVDGLPNAGFSAQLICLSRNFGSFAAIRVGLSRARGAVIAVMAADLQEPPALVLEFLQALADDRCDVAFGVREARSDPWTTRLASGLFWSVYRRFVMPEIPKGGVDIFALSSGFRDRLLQLGESHSSLLAQLFWLGGRRAMIPYRRLPRQHGKSGWTLRKKLRYLSDSVFSFTDLPVRLLLLLGGLAMLVAMLMTVVIVLAKVSGVIGVPGYAGTMLAILFFGAFNALGLGVVGAYAWRAFENTKARPLAVIQSEVQFDKAHP